MDAPNNPTLMTRERAAQIVEQALLIAWGDNPTVLSAWRLVRDQPWLPLQETHQDADPGRRKLTRSE
jgi:hypothetical protein